MYYGKTVLLTLIGGRGEESVHLGAPKAMQGAGEANSLRQVCLGLLLSCFVIAGTILLQGQDFMS